ncbi:MAG: class I SAM-dependent methyltransferase [Candidatus Eisenbacteria bacterium]|uniref:Class I SAM-dependent methyltransferase n=1 Tax=Eiseniibacteriota bacterium TaxID=2212470 RepID=A0A538TL52_UNCEI|nr:MAG: class I SAM-dependent methyltransferase [Candidatus Eisenbacteria bacterium]
MRTSTEAHWSRFWRERSEIEDVYPTDGRVVEQILAEGPVSGRLVLEVGAGSGRDSISLAEAGATAVLLDYSAPSLEVARGVAARAGRRVHLVRADALAMPFRDGSFHVVFHQGLLEHFRDPRPLLRENVRVLGERGILLVDVPQRFHLYTVLKHLLIAVGRWFAGWETEFTIAELERLLRAAGVTVTRRYGSWMVPGLFYRSLRLVLLRSRVARLPLYPPPVPILSKLETSFRERFRRTRASFYTYFVIGALGRKERADSPRSGVRIG